MHKLKAVVKFSDNFKSSRNNQVRMPSRFNQNSKIRMWKLHFYKAFLPFWSRTIELIIIKLCEQEEFFCRLSMKFAYSFILVWHKTSSKFVYQDTPKSKNVVKVDFSFCNRSPTALILYMCVGWRLKKKISAENFMSRKNINALFAGPILVPRATRLNL